MPYQIVYSSKASAPMNAAQLEEILVDARIGNERRDITGALVYVDGVFLQILEGDRAVLESLVANIRADGRHDAMKVFHEAEVPARAFSDWRMAYLGPDVADMSRWAGLEGAGTIDELMQHIHGNAQHVPRILISIVKAIAKQSQQR